MVDFTCFICQKRCVILCHDVNAKKLGTMQLAFLCIAYTQFDVARLYVPFLEGNWGSLTPRENLAFKRSTVNA